MGKQYSSEFGIFYNPAELAEDSDKGEKAIVRTAPQITTSKVALVIGKKTTSKRPFKTPLTTLPT